MTHPKEQQLAKEAFALLEKHYLSPTPENYAIFYHYLHRENKELVREIDALVKNKIKFTPETCGYLHNKYVVGTRGEKTVDDAAGAAQKVLLEVLRVVNDFSGEQKSYNKDVDQYLDHIGQDFSDPNVKNIFKELVSATTNLKKSGEKISKKLEESKTEINTLKHNLQTVMLEAQRDFLTGLFNRKTFERLFDEHAAYARESKTELCLLMIDIDHFKQFNDKFGHLLGDEVLKIVGRTLTEILKGRDVVARFGGEEFIVLLPETPIEGALKVADSIRTTISGKELKRKDTGEHCGTLTVSMGVARFKPEDSLPMIIKRADDALFQSKRAGRNRVTRGVG